MARPLVLLCLLAGGGQGRPNNLEESLRRQLMVNNYEYIEASDDSDQLTTQMPLARDEMPSMRAGDDDNGIFLESDELNEGDDIQHQHLTLDEFVRRRAAKRPQPSLYASRRRGDAAEAPIAVNHRDLHYYMDDTQISNNQLINKFDAETRETACTTARYSLLEVREKPGLSGRRSAQGPSLRRFLQEESPDHVAIVPLDDGPLPEFRLPQNRRQYMGNFDNESELGEEETPTMAAIFSYATPPTLPSALSNRAPLPEMEPLPKLKLPPQAEIVKNSAENSDLNKIDVSLEKTIDLSR